MNFEKINQWLSLLANIGVVIGIIFLALEIRTNTATNRIAIRSSLTESIIEINGGIAGNRDLVRRVFLEAKDRVPEVAEREVRAEDQPTLVERIEDERAHRSRTRLDFHNSE